MNDAPAFDFYPERWLAGVAAMTKTDQAVYLFLLCHSWLEDGLPEDLRTLKRLAGNKVSPEVLAKFPVGGDGLRRNARLEQIRSDQRKRIANSKSKSAKMHAARYGDKQPPSSAPSSAPSSHQAVLEGCPPPTSHPKERKSTASLAESIANAYPRKDAPLEVLSIITADLDEGQDPDEMMRAVQFVAGKIQNAPGGSSNQFVPKAQSFFTKRDWRSPESFEKRWTTKAETNGHKRVPLTSAPNNGW